MSEYIKKVDLLAKAVEVEYLGRPRLMVSVAQIGNTPAIDVVRCKDCKWRDNIGCALRIVDETDKPKDDDFCSYGEVRT